MSPSSTSRQSPLTIRPVPLARPTPPAPRPPPHSSTTPWYIIGCNIYLSRYYSPVSMLCCSWRWRPRASRASLCGARCRGRVQAPPSLWSGHPSTSTSCSSSAYLYHYYYYLLLLLPFTLHHIAYFTSNTLYCQHYRIFRQNINETILS